MIERLAELVNADPALVRRGRFLSASFLVEIGDEPWLVTVREGRIERVEHGPFLLRSWAFGVRGTREAWQRFWEPVPPPGWHDLFALVKRGHARVEGNLQPFMANLAYIGLGHFPMSEDPARFRRYLLPVLEAIRAGDA